MFKRLGLSFLAFSILTAPVVLSAHEGHKHNVMGTVTAVDATRLELKDKDGKTVSLLLNNETKYVKGRSFAAASDLKVGDRVVVEVAGEGDKLTAKEVKLGKAPAPKGAPQK